MKVVDIKQNRKSDNPDVVLDRAIGQFSEVFILGYDENGILDARSSTNWDTKSILFAIECFKAKLLNGDYSEEE